VPFIFVLAPTYQQVATVTNPLGHTASYAYNVRGKLSSVTNPLGHKTTYRYNAAAELTSVTGPLGNTTWFNYGPGGLVEVVDPLGRTSKLISDSVGRTTSLIAPLGNKTQFQYDGFSQQTHTTDALQGIIVSTYDENGNLKDITDARNNVTRFTYDNMDRLIVRRDPLLQDETFE
jgi:YD repeat-containing protein